MSKGNATIFKAIARILVCIVLFVALGAGLVTGAFAQTPPTPLAPGSIQVSRIQYDGNSFGSSETYPDIFNDPTITGIQGSIFIDQFSSVPQSAVAGTLPLPSSGSPVATYPTPEPGTYITSSFSSKSEGALMLSGDGTSLTYMGYQGVDELGGVSNSYSLAPYAQLSPNTPPNYDREVALINSGGLVSLTPIDDAYSGDNPRAVITADENEFYMAGNADSTTYKPTPVTGPGTSIGVRCGIPALSVSYQLGTYFAADRTDESTKQHYKDNNWRGIGIYTDANGNQDLYVSKGSGGNGDDGVFQVEDGAGAGLPSCTSGGTDTNNTIVELFGAPATDPTMGAASPYTPFGFWFANPTTLYVADEGYANLDANNNLIPDPLAGLEKWSLVNGTWTLDYTIQAGLNLYQPQTISGYPVPTYPTGIRNLTGAVNGDGTVTLYAITAQYSSISGGEPDPTSLVGITDSLAATTLPANEQFATLQNSGTPEVYRGVAFIPPAPGTTRQSQTITFPSVGRVTYGVSPITLAATATSGWPVAYTVTAGPATVLGNVLTITGAGSVTVEADQSGNTDYSAAPSVVQTFTVSKASQSITFTIAAPSSAAYNTSFTVAAVASSGLPVTYSNGGSCTNSGATYTVDSGIGECDVRVSQPGNGNYAAASPVDEMVLATPATPSISFTGATSNAVYGSAFTLIATTNASTSAVITATDPATCSLSGSSSPVAVTIVKGSGTCTFTAKWAADNNYTAASATQVTKVEKALSVLTWTAPASIIYGTPLGATELDASANVAGTFTYTPGSGAVENAGNVTLKVAFKPTNTNYANANATVPLQVLVTATATTITSPSSTVTPNKVGVAGAVVKYNVTSYKPTGAVTLTASTGEVCSGAIGALTGNGSCKLTFTTTGTRTIIASYSGDKNHLSSDSSSQNPPVTVTVNP